MVVIFSTVFSSHVLRYWWRRICLTIKSFLATIFFTLMILTFDSGVIMWEEIQNQSLSGDEGWSKIYLKLQLELFKQYYLKLHATRFLQTQHYSNWHSLPFTCICITVYNMGRSLCGQFLKGISHFEWLPMQKWD